MPENTKAAVTPAANDPLGARELAVVATTVALVAAVFYVAQAVNRHYVQDTFANVSRDVIWMSPLANLVWYFVGWAFLALIGRLIGGKRGFLFGAWALFSMFVFSLLLRYTAIDRLACIIFAAGAGTALLRVFNRSPGTWLRRARGVRNVLVVFFVVAGVAVTAGGPVRRGLAMNRIPAPPNGAPNIILLVLDAVRADALHRTLAGRAVAPFLDSLAGSGAEFVNAFSTTSWTLSSHGSMFTGQYANRLSPTLRKPLDETYPILGELLTAHGYYTYGQTANLHYTSWESGLSRGFLEWADFQRTFRQLLRSAEIGQMQMLLEAFDATTWREALAALRRHSIYVSPKPESHSTNATRMTDRLLAWHARKPDRPYVAFLNYYDAHFPYTPPAIYRERFGSDATAKSRYYAEVSYIDDELRRLFDGLRARNALDNTYVIITADHGEHFGERNKETHGNSVYTAVLHVPLIVLGPGIQPTRIDTPVTLRDLAATIADVAGLGSAFPGSSLVRHVADSTFQPSKVLASWTIETPQHTYVDGEHQLVALGDTFQLFAYQTDPANVHDLASLAEHSARLLAMRRELEALLTDSSIATVTSSSARR